MSSDEEAHISAPEPKRPATGDAEKQQQPDMNDVHFTHHEGTTRFFVVYNKKPIPLFFNLETETVGMLKECVRKMTGVTEGLKLMLRGAILKDESQTLAAVGIKATAKLLLVGSSAKEIEDVNDRRGVSPVSDTPVLTAAARGALPVTLGEGVQELPVHRRVIEAGPPANVLPGVRGGREMLPAHPITGLVNGRREATRLTFKPYAQEVWISTVSQTEKVPFMTIRNVMWEPIKGHEEYAMVAFQLGRLDSERSRYYVYWVPVQYAQAIRNTIM